MHSHVLRRCLPPGLYGVPVSILLCLAFSVTIRLVFIDIVFRCKIWSAKEGQCAHFLSQFLGLADVNSTVISFRGNNNLSDHPYKHHLPEEPKKVGNNLEAFANLLPNRNSYNPVFIISLTPRPDVSKELVTQSNNLILERLPDRCPRNISSAGHFLNDNVHLNVPCNNHTTRLFQREIDSVR